MCRAGMWRQRWWPRCWPAGCWRWPGSVAAATTATTAPAAPNRVTFGVEPATAAGPDGRPYFSIDATPGAVVFDHVAALELFDHPRDPPDVRHRRHRDPGAAASGCSPRRRKPIGVGAWITIPPGFATVVVPPRTATGPGQVVAPLTIRVPLKEAPGDHAGGIIVSLQTVGRNRTGQNVVLNQRVGHAVYVDVTGVLTPKSTLTDLHATYDGTANPVGKGHMAVSYEVVNSGNANLSVAQSVKVSGLVADTTTVVIPKIPICCPGPRWPSRSSCPAYGPRSACTPRSPPSPESSRRRPVFRLWPPSPPVRRCGPFPGPCS